MPNTRYLSLTINNIPAELPNTDEVDFGFKLSYVLEEPNDFTSKQGADPQNITLPASKVNDQIFNTFHNPQVEDTSPTVGGVILNLLTSVAGSGYIVGDTSNVTGGSVLAVLKVTSVGGGGSVTGFTLVSGGMGYSVGTEPTTNITGSGTGWVVTIGLVSVSGGIIGSPREYMPCVFSVNGSTPVLNGYALLNDVNYTDKPESYDLTIYGASGQWVIDLQNVTLWDCVNPNSHSFDLGTVKGSWTGYGTTPDHDYVYAPVRYRQPFDGTTLGYQGDNCVNIYHLRPSISLLRLIQRGFNSIGYTISSQFFTTAYFKGLVLPWVWGDFYDLNSQLVQGVTFKAVGELSSPTEPPPINGLAVLPLYGPISFWSGNNSASASLEGSAGGSSWWRSASRGGSGAVGGYNPGAYVPGTNPLAGSVYNRTTNSYVSFNGIYDATDTAHPGTGLYVMNGNGNSGGGVDHFVMDIHNPPDGYDNFSLYSFDPTTGTMQYDFNPPPSLAGTLSNVSATFVFSLYLSISSTGTGQFTVSLEILHVSGSGADTISTNISIKPSGGAWVGSNLYPSTDVRYPLTPTNSSFTIPNLNPGDTLTFRVRIVDDGSQVATYGIFSGGYLNNNPSVLGVPSYAYNPVTQQFQFITPNAIWSPLQSSLNMTGFLVQLGNTVNLQNYDAFRNYAFLDMLGGVIDMFNLEVSTDNINQIVTIEPMFGSTLPTAEAIAGYFSTRKLFDWSNKRDYSEGKGSKLTNYNSTTRQLDLTFKLDGSDGAQNIWGQRYKSIYLSNRTYTGGINQNNINIDSGIVAGIPGAARYMLPNRFAKGNTQMTNRFFSATMHCPFPQWIDVSGSSSPAPQLITIFSDSDSSSEAYSQTFTPKLAFYGGQRPIADIGGWIFIGDPASPDTNPNVSELPFMFAVNYGTGGLTDPCLSYSDENIGGAVAQGLMTQFYRQRFAIMRNGQLLTANIRLNLNDVCNWPHRECIMIDGTLYALIQIDGYDPLRDESTQCTLWKVVLPENVDVVNSYPSATSVLTNPNTLPNSFDLRYAQLLIYATDLPQVS